MIDFIAQGQRFEYISDKLRELEASVRADKAELKRLDRAIHSPFSLPSIDAVTEMVFDLDGRLSEDPDVGREVLRQWLEGPITMTPLDSGRYRIEGRVLPAMVLGSIGGASKKARQRARKGNDNDKEGAQSWPNVHDGGFARGELSGQRRLFARQALAVATR